MTGGAVRVAEPMNTDDPQFTTNLDGKLVETDPVLVNAPKLIKTRQRELPRVEDRRRRIVERTIECQPLPAGFGPAGTDAIAAAPLPTGATAAYYDAAECPPIAAHQSLRSLMHLRLFLHFHLSVAAAVARQ